MNLKTFDKYLINAIVIWAIGFFIFALISFFQLKNIQYIIGWTYGAFISYTAFYLNIVMSKFFLRKKRGRYNAMFFGFIKFFVNIFYAIILLGILFIVNPLVNGHNILNSAIMPDFYGPINIFTTIAGISLMGVSIFLTNLGVLKHKSKKSLKNSSLLMRKEDGSAKI